MQGKVSQLTRTGLPAGRALLAQALAPAPLPEIVYSQHGKPGFAGDVPLWFNLSHSGDDIVLLLSDEGEVGCDIEVIRPRKNMQSVVDAVFSEAEQRAFAEADAPVPAFWRIWTQKEALLKQAGGHLWQIADCDSSAPAPLFLQHTILCGTRMLALCTPSQLSADIVISIPVIK